MNKEKLHSELDYITDRGFWGGPSFLRGLVAGRVGYELMERMEKEGFDATVDKYDLVPTFWQDPRYGIMVKQLDQLQETVFVPQGYINRERFKILLFGDRKYLLDSTDTSRRVTELYNLINADLFAALPNESVKPGEDPATAIEKYAQFHFPNRTHTLLPHLQNPEFREICKEYSRLLAVDQIPRLEACLEAGMKVNKKTAGLVRALSEEYLAEMR